MPGLSRDEVELALKRVTYKPGWKITVEDGPYEGLYIRITAQVEDAYRPGITASLGINSYLPPLPSESSFYDWLLWRLQRVESHECREWFKIEDKPWSDPHAEDAIDG